MAGNVEPMAYRGNTLPRTLRDAKAISALQLREAATPGSRGDTTKPEGRGVYWGGCSGVTEGDMGTILLAILIWTAVSVAAGFLAGRFMEAGEGEQPNREWPWNG